MPPQSVLEILGREGRCLYSPASGCPPVRVPHPGLRPLSHRSGARGQRGRKPWPELQGPWPCSRQAGLRDEEAGNPAGQGRGPALQGPSALHPAALSWTAGPASSLGRTEFTSALWGPWGPRWSLAAWSQGPDSAEEVGQPGDTEGRGPPARGSWRLSGRSPLSCGRRIEGLRCPGGAVWPGQAPGLQAPWGEDEVQRHTYKSALRP